MTLFNSRIDSMNDTARISVAMPQRDAGPTMTSPVKLSARGLNFHYGDFHAVHERLISVTPIHLDLTNYKSFEALKALTLSWP